MYLPPDTNCLLSVADHCLRSRQYVNVIVAGKQPSLNYLPWKTRCCTAPGGSGFGTGRPTTGRPRRRHGLLRGYPDAGNTRCG